jgi:hypothetical protein
MLWVTFGRARFVGMTVAVGAKMKDENCFAQQSDATDANRAALAV